MFKKWTLVATILLWCLAITSVTQAQKMFPAPPQLAAKAWILVDADTGYVIAENNADETLPPASLAKMMTTYITSNEIKEKRLKEDDLVLI
ncbi:MAG: serine-type D-Ala-D-Ala carboxypeptidase, partial [Porticoccaceae bacterium]|nr:serine-type D-Ala-D-Ala carboxypeptidase [Porticoccaceae bacterium]